MTVRDFLSSVNRINESIKNQNEIIAFLTEIASFNNEYLELCVDLRSSFVNNNASTSHSKMSPIISKIVGLENKSLKAIREFKPYVIVTKLNSLKSELEKIEIFKTGLENFLKEDIQKLIDYHTDAYSEKGFKEIFAFVSYSAIFVEKLNKIKFSANIFIENLKLVPAKIPPNNILIDIQIISELENLETFSNFLVFLDKLYQDLCKSFEIHYEDYPLTIIKVESGSVWTNLLGNKNIVGLTKDLIFGLAGYIRDLQTGEIKKENLKNRVEEAGLILELISKANEVGVPKDKKVLLEKTFGQAITNISNALPETTTEIIIDETRILNLSEPEIKLIESRKPKLLKEGNDKKKEK